jgi:uncharacterized membrane protein YccC
MTTASTPHPGAAEHGRTRFVLSDNAKYSIKLGLAIAITYGLALRAAWMSPTWAAIAVAMVGQQGHGQSLYKGMLRGAGTLIAFFSGLLILSLYPQDRWMVLVATSPFLGYFTYRMKGENDYMWFVAAFVTPMIVMAGPEQPGHAFEFAAYRTLETLMGIGVWAMVSVFLWPATNFGVLESATDKLLATQQKVLEAFREAATGNDLTGAPPALQEQESQLVGQVGSLIDVVAAETYEVRGVRGAWHRLHAASLSFLHVSSRVQLGLSDFERVPLSSVLPAVPELLAELEARLTEARSLLGGAPPARPCRDVALEVDAEAFGALGHLARAGVAAGRAELAALDAHTRTIVECALEIREDKRARSTASADTAPAKARGLLRLVPLDRDQLMAAILAVSTMWIGTLIWFYLNPPGHVAWFQFPTNFVLVALRNPQMRFFPLRVLGYAYFAALLVYAFIMPHLSGFVQLGSLLFAFTFITAYFLPRDRVFLLLAMFNMFGISNEQTYDFASMMNTYVFTMSGILMVYAMTYVVGSPRPEKTLLGQLRRFFKSCEFLLSRPPEPESWVDRIQRAYHRRELQTLPDKITTWGAQINPKRFPQNSVEQVRGLAVRTQLFAFRIDDLLNLQSRPEAKLSVRELGDEIDGWRALLEEAFREWSGAAEAGPTEDVHERLSGQLAQLNARVEEKVSRIQAGESGDAAGEGFYRVLGAFRGVTRAGLAYDKGSREIDWDAWREEQFS